MFPRSLATPSIAPVVPDTWHRVFPTVNGLTVVASGLGIVVSRRPGACPRFIKQTGTEEIPDICIRSLSPESAVCPKKLGNIQLRPFQYMGLIFWIHKPSITGPFGSSCLNPLWLTNSPDIHTVDDALKRTVFESSMRVVRHRLQHLTDLRDRLTFIWEFVHPTQPRPGSLLKSPGYSSTKYPHIVRSLTDDHAHCLRIELSPSPTVLAPMRFRGGHLGL